MTGSASTRDNGLVVSVATARFRCRPETARQRLSRRGWGASSAALTAVAGGGDAESTFDDPAADRACRLLHLVGEDGALVAAVAVQQGQQADGQESDHQRGRGQEEPGTTSSVHQVREGGHRRGGQGRHRPAEHHRGGLPVLAQPAAGSTVPALTQGR
jgi:hypothetical protein